MAASPMRRALKDPSPPVKVPAGHLYFGFSGEAVQPFGKGA